MTNSRSCAVWFVLLVLFLTACRAEPQREARVVDAERADESRDERVLSRNQRVLVELLTEWPTAERIPGRDMALLSLASSSSIQELVLIEGEILDVLIRDGVEPIASFLMHYIERLAFAQPPNWERRVDDVLMVAETFLPLKKLPERDRTIGAIRFGTTPTIEIFSLELANLFFCKVKTDSGRASLETGGGAHEIMALGVVLGEYCPGMQRPAEDDEEGQRLWKLCQEASSSCVTEEDSGRPGSGGGAGNFGLGDSFMACADPGAADQARIMREVEAVRRCAELRFTSPTDPLASGGGSWSAPGGLKEGGYSKHEWWENEEGSGEENWDWSGEEITDAAAEDPNVAGAVDELQAASDDYMGCEGSEGPGDPCHESLKEFEQADQEFRDAMYCHENPDNCQSTEDGVIIIVEDAEEEEEDDPDGTERVATPVEGQLPDVCLPEALRLHKTTIRDLMGGAELPLSICQVALTQGDQCDQQVDSECRPWQFMMPAAATQCAGVFSRLCQLIDLPPDSSPLDLCACYQEPGDFSTTPARWSELLAVLMTVPGACQRRLCADGYRCDQQTGGCVPEFESADDPVPPGPEPQPGAIHFLHFWN